MIDIGRRVKNVEKKLNLRKKPLTITIVLFGGGQPPPDETVGNITYHFVAYDEIKKQ